MFSASGSAPHRVQRRLPCGQDPDFSLEWSRAAKKQRLPLVERVRVRVPKADASQPRGPLPLAPHYSSASDALPPLRGSEHERAPDRLGKPQGLVDEALEDALEAARQEAAELRKRLTDMRQERKAREGQRSLEDAKLERETKIWRLARDPLFHDLQQARAEAGAAERAVGRSVQDLEAVKTAGDRRQAELDEELAQSSAAVAAAREGIRSEVRSADGRAKAEGDGESASARKSKRMAEVADEVVEMQQRLYQLRREAQGSTPEQLERQRCARELSDSLRKLEVERQAVAEKATAWAHSRDAVLKARAAVRAADASLTELEEVKRSGSPFHELGHLQEDDARASGQPAEAQAVSHQDKAPGVSSDPQEAPPPADGAGASNRAAGATAEASDSASAAVVRSSPPRSPSATSQHPGAEQTEQSRQPAPGKREQEAVLGEAMVSSQPVHAIAPEAADHSNAANTESLGRPHPEMPADSERAEAVVTHEDASESSPAAAAPQLIADATDVNSSGEVSSRSDRVSPLVIEATAQPAAVDDEGQPHQVSLWSGMGSEVTATGQEAAEESLARNLLPPVRAAEAESSTACLSEGASALSALEASQELQEPSVMVSNPAHREDDDADQDFHAAELGDTSPDSPERRSRQLGWMLWQASHELHGNASVGQEVASFGDIDDKDPESSSARAAPSSAEISSTVVELIGKTADEVSHDGATLALDPGRRNSAPRASVTSIDDMPEQELTVALRLEIPSEVRYSKQTSGSDHGAIQGENDHAEMQEEPQGHAMQEAGSNASAAERALSPATPEAMSRQTSACSSRSVSKQAMLRKLATPPEMRDGSVSVELDLGRVRSAPSRVVQDGVDSQALMSKTSSNASSRSVTKDALLRKLATPPSSRPASAHLHPPGARHGKEPMQLSRIQSTPGRVGDSDLSTTQSDASPGRAHGEFQRLTSGPSTGCSSTPASPLSPVPPSKPAPSQSYGGRRGHVVRSSDLNNDYASRAASR